MQQNVPVTQAMGKGRGDAGGPMRLIELITLLGTNSVSENKLKIY